MPFWTLASAGVGARIKTMFESLTERQKTAYAKKKITNDELLRRFLPSAYKDFRTPVLLSRTHLPAEGEEIAVIGYEIGRAHV